METFRSLCNDCEPKVRLYSQGTNAVCFLFLVRILGIQEKEADLSSRTRYLAYTGGKTLAFKH